MSNNVTIDGKSYEIDALPQETKAIIGNLQFVNGELARLRAMTAILRTAQQAYSKALKASLPAFAPEAAGA